MSAVTVEGSVTPSSYLPRGERRTVERTEFVDKLIRRGFLTVVTEHPDPAVEEPPIDPEGSTVTVAPKRSASRDEWAAFLTEADIEFSEEDTRDELIGRWDDAEADNG